MKFEIYVRFNAWGQKLLHTPIAKIQVEQDITLPAKFNSQERHLNCIPVEDLNEQDQSLIKDILYKEYPMDIVDYGGTQIVYKSLPYFKAGDVVRIKIPASAKTHNHAYEAISHVEDVNEFGFAYVNVDPVMQDLRSQYEDDLTRNYVLSKTSVSQVCGHKRFIFDAVTGIDMSQAKTSKWTIEPVDEETTKIYSAELKKKELVQRHLMPMVSLYMDIVYGDPETRKAAYDGLGELFQSKEFARLAERIISDLCIVGGMRPVAEKMEFCKCYKTLDEFNEMEVEDAVPTRA